MYFSTALATWLSRPIGIWLLGNGVLLQLFDSYGGSKISP